MVYPPKMILLYGVIGLITIDFVSKKIWIEDTYVVGP